MSGMKLRLVGAIVLGMMLLALLLGLAMHRPDLTTPLPWDMSHHYLGALQFRDAARTPSVTQLGKSLFESDLYPPGHSILLGSWMLIAGESSVSLFMFMCLTLWVFLLALTWLLHPLLKAETWIGVIIGTVLLGACSRFVALSGTFMVDAPAAVLALLSLAGLIEAQQKPTLFRLLGALALTAFTLLTKYNVGLPLVPVAIAMAAYSWIAGERRTATKMLGVGILALAIWAAFLSLQANGWSDFLRFAHNRANSQEWSWFGRLRFYTLEFRNHFFARPSVGWIALLLAAMSLVRIRSYVIIASVVYVLTTAVALARHPYLLDRNLVSVAAVIIAIASVGGALLVQEISRRCNSPVRWSMALGVCWVAVLMLVASIGTTRASITREFGTQGKALKPLSEFVAKELREEKACTVIGTFNAFSPGWVRILWMRIPVRVRPALTIGFPYPLEGTRSGLDPSPNVVYLQRINDWKERESPKLVLTIDVRENSIFNDADYKSWNAWKRNYIQAVKNSPDARLLNSVSVDSQRVVGESISLGNAPLEFGPGWGGAEPWGRWAMEKQAVIEIPAPAAGCEVEVEVAAYEGLSATQTCVVTCGREQLASFEVSRPSWQWQVHKFTIPASIDSDAARLEFRFGSVFPGNNADPRLRALPFRTVLVSKGLP